MKIVALGCGKRFKNVYYDIINRLGYEIFLWNRTQEKSKNFCQENKNCHLIEKLEDLNQINADLILCFTPPQSQYEIISKIKSDKTPILIETPVEDQRLFSLSKTIGVLEQWPKLPLEQFKELIYQSKLISRPYMVFNDGRSFDYHAISQLRTYLNFASPVFCNGSVKSYQNLGILDSSNKLNTKNHEWTVGQIEMSNGSLLCYSFAYNCKSLLTIPVQLIRSYSIDGSIMTGRMKEIGNDYEVIDVRIVESHTQAPKICEVKFERKNNTTVSLKVENVTWENPYKDLDFDDQQTAIATIIDEGIKGIVYSHKNAYIDYMCINMMKQSGYHHQVIKVG